MPHHHRCVAAVVLALALAPLSLQAQDGFFSPSTAACQRAELDPAPGWTVSGAWRGKELLLVDNLWSKVRQYSDTGQSLGDLPDALARSMTDPYPSSIRPRGSGFLMSTSHVTIVALDHDYNTLRQSTSFEETKPSAKVPLALHSLYDWNAVSAPAGASGGTEIVSFSDVQAAGGNWRTGFVRFQMDKVEDLSFLKGGEVAMGDSALTFYRLGLQYVASLGSTAYVVDFSRGFPRLLKNLDRSGELIDLGAKLPATPIILPKFDSQADFAPLMRAVEKTTMPYGLYGWEGSLYLLNHTAAAAGPIWTLKKIDPRTGAEVGSTRLPLRANHVTVVPGHDKWAFIEKGPVEGFGLQKVNTIFFVPSEALFSLQGQGRVCK